VVSVVEPSSWNCVDGTATAGVASSGTGGLVAVERAVVMPVVTTVVAGLDVDAGLAAVLAAIAAPAAATTIGTVPAEGFVTGKLPPARTAAGGRLGLTVMRAVSLGGAVLTTEVPVLPPRS